MKRFFIFSTFALCAFYAASAGAQTLWPTGAAGAGGKPDPARCGILPVSAGEPVQDPVASVRKIERIATPWSDHGKPQTLEVVVFQPPGVGPFPTLVMNHGSTGNGDRPERFTDTWTSIEVAGFFNRRGWQVLYPQRRGRGKSDGLYDEGFEADRSRYSADPALALQGLERALTDLDVVMAHVAARSDVDTRCLLLGGVSRGGLLATVYAGTRAVGLVGVLNFVGGWLGDRRPGACAVNAVMFSRAAAFDRPMLWLYGDNDPFYSLRRSRQNFEAFTAAGGRGRFVTFDAPVGRSGHAIHTAPALWEPAVDAYLEEVSLRR